MFVYVSVFLADSTDEPEETEGLCASEWWSYYT